MDEEPVNTQAFLDEKIEGYSNISVGMLLRSLASNQKVAYIDCLGTSTKLSNFFENLSLSFSFTNSFNKLSMDIYSFKNDDKVQVTLIPDVEFLSITKEIFYKSLEDYDILIFDSISFEKISKYKIINILNSLDSGIEAIFIFNKEKEFNEIKGRFNKSNIITYKDNKLSIQNTKNIINITGGDFELTFFEDFIAYGILIRKFINKEDLRMIIFGQNEELYGEQRFFRALKKWSKENDWYGKFDFVVTTATSVDAKDGFALMRTSFKKLTPVFAIGLNLMPKINLLSDEEILNSLKELNSELIISGSNSSQQIKNLSLSVINVK